MKKLIPIHKIIVLCALLFSLSACEDFLNRPPEDAYTIDNFYTTDEQCFQAANTVYSSPWYDYQRGFISIGDVLAGNVFKGTDNPYQNFSITASNQELADASNALWLVNGHCNSIIKNINTKAGSAVTQTTKNTVLGEVMTWKAFAYFFLVRGWGAVPIIHNNSELIDSKTTNTVKKIKEADVYEYIVRTLKKAADLLPAKNTSGRINKYSAYALLSKVYLTRSGLGRNGDRNQEDLDNAKLYAGKVIKESGASLEPEYYNLFRISTGNRNPENLISWQWVISTNWTSQNSLQSDLALSNFTGMGDSWGGWTGLTIDLQSKFGEDPSGERQNTDARRKATMMMYNDYYPLFWRHKGGFKNTWDAKTNVAEAVPGVGTGANCVKHIVGHIEDHKAETGGIASANMATNLSTHLLRLADIYLIYAEAVLGNNVSTSDAEALRLYNAVCKRSIKTWTDKTSLTFREIFDERRRELACEGDNWFDFVRLHYYKPKLAKDYLNEQERGSYNNLEDFYKGKKKKEDVTLNTFKLSISDDKLFTLPFPENDQGMNPNLRPDVAPADFDFSTIEY